MAASGIKDIKRRKKSIENTMKITKAMELVAFSKLRKSKKQVEQTRPFFNKIYNLINDIVLTSQNVDSIFVNQSLVKKSCYIILAGDKGLAGGYNGNLIRFTEQHIKKYNKSDLVFITIGKKISEFYKKQNYNLLFDYSNIYEKLTFELAMEISNKIINNFINNHFQEVYIIFTKFVSTLVQKPNVKKILPLNLTNLNNVCKKQKYVVYEPSVQEVFNAVVPLYIAGILYGAITEAFAAEQGARRIAMEAANKNAQGMLQDINIIFNKVRQSKITQEINEISAGTQAI